MSRFVAYGRRAISAHSRSLMRRVPLAPGRLVFGDSRYRKQLTFLLDCAEAYGPVFRLWTTGEVTTCIVGHAAGKRFLSENLERTSAFTVDLRPMFEHGTVRGMPGERHRAYRRKLVEAFRATPIEPHRTAIAEAIRFAFDRIATAQEPVPARELRAIFKETATTILMRTMLGVTGESPACRLLPEQLERYGPRGPIDEVDRAAITTFADLHTTVLAEIDRQKTSPAVQVPSLLGQMLRAGTLDETLLGNLIQNLQTGRYDLIGLFSWLTQFLASAPDILTRIRDRTDGAASHSLATAVVLETLRLAQSEYLLRRATADIVFDGFLIPRGSLVRICIWEGHRDGANFADPTAFLPDRFLGKEYPLTSYAPFGLDHHRCTGADWTMDISTMFAEILAQGYRLGLASVGPPVGGRHHFEPGPGFAIRLDRLTTDELTAAGV